MTTETLLDLAARCEAAKGPDRELDGDIALAFGIVPAWATIRAPRQPELFMDRGAGLHARTWTAPHFTSSLDSAMRLVPGNALFALRTLWDEGKTAGYAFLNLYHETGEGKTWGGDANAVASTPALALCAASLRASAKDEGR